jgi:hypothetical protein
VVTATPGGSILATMRVIWGKGYDELMGYPANELTNEYFFPLYSNTSLNTQLRIGNTGSVPAEVDVYIGGVKMNGDPYIIAVGGNLRIIYGSTGYDELMGYPGNQLATEYLFPWYNNKAMQSTIAIAVP